VAIDDDLVLGHILKAYLLLYASSADGTRNAAALLKRFEGTDAGLNERELLHLRTARAWAAGDWDGATHLLERALLHNSRDLLALKLAQDLYLQLGQSRELQGVASRVRRAWPPERPGWGYLQGLFAFGLEENGEYAQAEVFARAALHHNAQDTWAAHALAHVLAMQSRPQEGIAFLTETERDWSSSFFAVHQWWHKALFHLDLGDPDSALSLYDGPIRKDSSLKWPDLVDAAALLWRLSLLGLDVKERATELTRDIEPLLAEPTYIFNDWHAVMAFSLAGRHDLSGRLLASNRRDAHGTNKTVAEQAGLALLEGFDSFASGQVDRAADVLTHVGPFAHAVGGSHIQRDIISLTVIHAAPTTRDTAKVVDLEAHRNRALATTGPLA